MPLSSEALLPLLQLALLPGVGPTRLALLMDRFGSPERILSAPPDELMAIPQLGARSAERIGDACRAPAIARAERAIEILGRTGAVVLTPDDPLFPNSFRRLSDRPYLLFAWGDLSLMDGPALGVVGTRNPSDYGRRTARGLTSSLARAGLTIVSGMAKGIDAVAHTAALDANASTVGVLGHGIDQVYPAENRELFARVRDHGLLITEHPPGEEPRGGNFPRRNRLIAALSLGVLIVEMGLKSGAQHTITYALEQGKEVFAVPGPIGASTSEGTNQIIKEGAAVVTSVEDVLDELERVSGLTFGRPDESDDDGEPPVELTEEESKILMRIGDEALHVDEIAERCGSSTHSLLGTLLALEINGSVEALPGKRFLRTRKQTRTL